ncbi:MAG: M23 family metallopeptidase [Enterocloster asparagiformis]|nr:M23 family metallopeptidase [Enterocloster asparagiformis]
MRDKINQMFKDKLFLVMLVLGLLTIVAAAGVFTVQRGNGKETSPYLEIPGPDTIAQEGNQGNTQVAGASDAAPVEETKEEAVASAKKETPAGNAGDDLAAEAGAGKEAARPLVLNFTDTSKMAWPVRGNVLLAYSMDQTIYFPTLDQYKCNPGLVIQSDVSTPVAAPANAKVIAVGSNEEIGNFVTLDLGNEYTAICGQLKEVCAVEGEYLEAGQTLGYVSEPTKYYSVEGVNVFFELQHQGKAVDPLDYME